MKEYSDLIEFWNKAFAGSQPSEIAGKWVTDNVFNSCISKYIKNNDIVLDYGCGTGWGIMEISHSVKIKEGIGIDTSKNAINNAQKSAVLSKLDNLLFIAGDEGVLLDMAKKFDCVVSFNVFDVLPDDKIYDVLKNVKYSMKKDAYLLVGINPDYPFELLQSIGYVKENGYLYKDGILRGNDKTKEEWISLLSEYFEFVEYLEFALTEREKKFPRRMFVMKNI